MIRKRTGIPVLDACSVFLEGLYARKTLPSRPILEAGGGSFSYFSLPSGAPLIALDISHGQLLRNEAATHRVQADLGHLPIASSRLGMVICFNVIEHLDDPDDALAQLIAALAPGGLLVLGCPDRVSLKGIITRATPFAVHRAFYRFVVGKKDRGDGHFDAFATPFRPLVASTALPGWLEANGMEILHFRHYDGAAAYRLTTGSLLRRVVALPYNTLAGALHALTGGRWGGRNSDILLVARRR